MRLDIQLQHLCAHQFTISTTMDLIMIIDFVKKKLTLELTRNPSSCFFQSL